MEARVPDYSPAGSRIILSAAVVHWQIQVDDADGGVGLAADSLLKIFDLFSRLPHSYESRKGGIGIGLLSLVRKIALLHGGSVRAFSAGIGKGATFTIQLPVTPFH